MSRHTEPMTDAYVTGQRLRNAARMNSAIEQLGARWLLHPENAIDPVESVAQRRATAFRENRLLIISNPTRDAFQRHAQKVFQSGLINLSDQEAQWIPAPGRAFESPQDWANHTIGRPQIDPDIDDKATQWREQSGFAETPRDKFVREGGEQ